MQKVAIDRDVVERELEIFLDAMVAPTKAAVANAGPINAMAVIGIGVVALATALEDTFREAAGTEADLSEGEMEFLARKAGAKLAAKLK